MRAVSEVYNPYTDARVCGIQVSFELIAVDAERLANASADSECAMSRVRQTHDRVEGMGAKFAMLERDYWKLDGSFILPPDNLAGLQTSWWSGAISGADGAFDTPPRLLFTWLENQSGVGFTVCFDDASSMYARRFHMYCSSCRRMTITSSEKSATVAEESLT